MKYDYYKFPGGGIKRGENKEEAMIRETLEEAGLTVIPETVREFGFVHRAEKSTLGGGDYFVQDNYYYLCDVMDTRTPQKLEEYEKDEQIKLEFIEPMIAIRKNRNGEERPISRMLLEREAMVLELLIKEGFFEQIYNE